MKKTAFSAHPETIWGETLAVIVAESDKAARRLTRAGIGARVRLTAAAAARGITVRRQRHATGVIVGWGDHQWTVKVRPDGGTTASAYHVRFWAPVPKGKTP
jgi:hypothetical protein